MNKGCGRALAKGQWWNFCGETDMGQSMPALCTECGGDEKLEIPHRYRGRENQLRYEWEKAGTTLSLESWLVVRIAELEIKVKNIERKAS